MPSLLCKAHLNQNASRSKYCFTTLLLYCVPLVAINHDYCVLPANSSILLLGFLAGSAGLRPSGGRSWLKNLPHATDNAASNLAFLNPPPVITVGTTAGRTASDGNIPLPTREPVPPCVIAPGSAMPPTSGSQDRLLQWQVWCPLCVPIAMLYWRSVEVRRSPPPPRRQFQGRSDRDAS